MPKGFFDVISPVYDFIIRGSPPAILPELLRLKGSERILEVGAGTGRSIKDLVKNSYSYSIWLLEPSIQMLRIASKKYPDVNIVHGYAEKLPFPSGSYDRIFAIDSFHHWDDHVKSLDEIYRVLKHRGLFLLIEFDPLTRIGHFIRSMEKTLLMGSKFFKPSELEKMLLNAGFEVVDYRKIDSGTYAMVSMKN